MKGELLYRHLAVFILFAAFFAQTFSNAFVIADYFTNTQAYAKNCVNKARPEMHCNGKCQMMKKMQREENKDQDAPQKKGENKNEVVLSMKSFFPKITDVYLSDAEIKKIAASLNNKPVDRSLDIFHPPSFPILSELSF